MSREIYNDASSIMTLVIHLLKQDHPLTFPPIKGHGWAISIESMTQDGLSGLAKASSINECGGGCWTRRWIIKDDHASWAGSWMKQVWEPTP
jgi:hypothetical protein